MSIFKNKWFGRTLMLVLACFMFLGLKDRVKAKADEARVIYTKEVEDVDGQGNVMTDGEGHPFTHAEYAFNKESDQSWAPYAVYITPASGSAITLDHSVFGGNYEEILIWDNNCGIVYVESDPIDKYSLVLTGPDSFIDVGYIHIQRGECDAPTYEGQDEANDIARYFNSFLFFNDDPNFPDYCDHINYWNEASVLFGFDANNTEPNSADPHYGKTVYYVDQDISVDTVTIDDNVVVFLQGSGMLRVSGQLSVGSGSYIESIDENLRLEITDPYVNVTGMQLYDYFGNDGETPLAEGKRAGAYYSTAKTINGVNTQIWTKFRDAIPNNAVGNSAVTSDAKKYIYAYANMDYDGDHDVDGDDLKYALAVELAYKYTYRYGKFDMSGIYGDDMETIWDKITNVTGDAAKLSSRINIFFSGRQKITMLDAYGNPVKIPRYTATVTWGKTDTGAIIEDYVYVYQLNIPEELIVCTDFNESTGTGADGTYYIRQRNDDRRVLIGPEDTNPATVHEDHFATVIATNSIGKVAAGGQAVDMYIKNVDRNLFTFQTIAYFKMKHYEGGWQPLDPGVAVKIFNTSGRFFATTSESSGEERRYDFVSHDATGNAADKVWEADGQYPVKLFIHDNILHIKPLNDNSGVAKAIKEVRLSDSIPAAAVTINNNEIQQDFVITFNSNFYDTVHFEIVYADDSVGAFTVEREGIIIQHTLTGDPAMGRYWLDIYGEGQGNEIDYNWLSSEDIVVMATYYHSSAEDDIDDLSLIITYDDGSTEIISSEDTDHGFSGYKSGAGYTKDPDDNDIPRAADTTSFIIGGNLVGNQFSRNGHTGGFSVQIVKAGYDAVDSFGGAMAGSGKGKYWNGIPYGSN